MNIPTDPPSYREIKHKEEEEYIDTIFAFVIHLYSFCISDYLPFLRGLGLEGHEKIVEDATSVLEKYNNPIIEDRIQQWRDGKKHEPQDLLDVLVSLKVEKK